MIKPTDAVFKWTLKTKEKTYKGSVSVADLYYLSKNIDAIVKRVDFNVLCTLAQEWGEE